MDCSGWAPPRLPFPCRTHWLDESCSPFGHIGWTNRAATLGQGLLRPSVRPRRKTFLRGWIHLVTHRGRAEDSAPAATPYLHHGTGCCTERASADGDGRTAFEWCARPPTTRLSARVFHAGRSYGADPDATCGAWARLTGENIGDEEAIGITEALLSSQQSQVTSLDLGRARPHPARSPVQLAHRRHILC